jgi:radical SAM superfamily enzyme YgiQ (UPF0313 family)
LRFISKRAAQPPLGLLTVAAMLPQSWEKKLIDVNVSRLRDKDIQWADMVFISAMSIQKRSAKEIIARCRRLGVRTVAGGPLFTAEPEKYDDVDHLVLNEAELTLPRFLHDLINGDASRLYTSETFADIEQTPIPLWSLANLTKYACMNIQYSRGCPFDCEFCDITVLCGRKVRTKSRRQLLAELEALHSASWRGDVFFVDDNFIGNAKSLKNDILPALAGWMDSRGHPFCFITEVSVNLADDKQLMQQMVRSGFQTVFVGIETTHDESLAECDKHHNRRRDLMACVRDIQGAGLQVAAGFILGFDNDPLSIFDKISAFIQTSGIVNAMVGLLKAPRHSRLYKRLAKEGRLLDDGTGDNTDLSINFVPKMQLETLIAGYTRVIRSIYSPNPFYERVRRFLREFRPVQRGTRRRLGFRHLTALLKSVVRLGILGKERCHYWKLVFWTILRRPRLLPLAVTYAVYGFHYRMFFEKHILTHPVDRSRMGGS